MRIADKGWSVIALGKLGTPSSHIAWLKKFSEPVTVEQAKYNPQVECMYIYKK